MAVLVDGVLVTGPFALTIQDPAGTHVPLHGGLRNVRDVKGLTGMAARTSIRPRVGRTGSVSVTRHREDRPVTVELQILGEDTQHALDDYYVLSRAVNSAVDTDRLLRWTLGTYNLQSLVRAESIEPPVLVAGRILETQIGLRATDPAAYDQTARVTPVAALTTVRIENPGTVPTPPVMKLTGPLTNPEIRLFDEAGAVVATLYVNTLASGIVVILDAAQRTITNETGEPRPAMMDHARSRWFEIAAPSQRVRLVAATGDTGSMEVTTRDAYQ